MKMFVFIGPTIREDEANKVLNAIYLPPAQVGDVYRAALEGPFAIGIIDGFFERVPSIWHKEILWALCRGIHVFGASSMGALRAAELHGFGMEGVGAIFEAFRSGDLQDDDEVAVAHGDASRQYRPSSEAMVNIRATLRLAESESVISSELRCYLESLAKKAFYADRNYPELLLNASSERAEVASLEALKSFISSRRVDAKRADALALLNRMGQCAAHGEPLSPRAFELANSEPWTQLRVWARGRPRLGGDNEVPQAQLIAAEARHLGQRGQILVANAFLRALASAPGDASTTTAVRERFAGELDEHIVCEARAAGLYDDLARRASDKRDTLLRHGLGDPTFSDVQLPNTYIVEWYLSRLGSDATFESATSQSNLHALGLKDAASLEHEALREFLYTRLVPQSSKDD